MLNQVISNFENIQTERLVGMLIDVLGVGKKIG